MDKKFMIFLTTFVFTVFYLHLSAQEKIYKTTTPVQVPRQMYGTVVLGNYLYLIGGNIQGKGEDPQGYVTNVEKAHVNPDGGLGPWEQTRSLPSNRSYIHNSTLALNDIVYIVMGIDGLINSATRTILWSKPRADGHLEPWQESEPYPGSGLKLSAAVATPGYLSILAGKDLNGNPTQDVWSAKVGPNGDIIGWEKGPSLPCTLYFHHAAVSGGRIWVWGGLKDNNLTLNNLVFEAPILSSGAIGKWSISSIKLQRPFYNAAVTVSGEYLLSFAPRYSPQISSSDIWFIQVKPEGLTEWQKIETDISSKLYIGVATDYRRGLIYIPGGRMNPLEDERSLTGTVFMLRLAASAKEDIRTESAATPTIYGPASGDGQLSYIQQSQQTTSVFPGFIPYEKARQISQSQYKPLVVYFYSSKAKLCRNQAQILHKFNGMSYQGRVIFTEVNVEDFPQIAQQYGIFRVPNWIFFDSSRVIKFRQAGVLSFQSLEASITSIAQ